MTAKSRNLKDPFPFTTTQQKLSKPKSKTCMVATSRNLKKPIPETSKTHIAFCKQQMRFFVIFIFISPTN
jgi:hypothetical protein